MESLHTTDIRMAEGILTQEIQMRIEERLSHYFHVNYFCQINTISDTSLLKKEWHLLQRLIQTFNLYIFFLFTRGVNFIKVFILFLYTTQVYRINSVSTSYRNFPVMFDETWVYSGKNHLRFVRLQAVPYKFQILLNPLFCYNPIVYLFLEEGGQHQYY